jgi:predicted nucleic acid-binding protein
MILIVDTNILFSACISPNNKISEILFSPLPNLQKVSSPYAIDELLEHKEKLVRMSKQTIAAVDAVLKDVLKQIEFYSDDLIVKKHWLEAYRLTIGVDSKDINFVALALQTGGTLWTGDKKLMNHLKKMGFDQVVTTAELYEKIRLK